MILYVLVTYICVIKVCKTKECSGNHVIRKLCMAGKCEMWSRGVWLILDHDFQKQLRRQLHCSFTWYVLYIWRLKNNIHYSWHFKIKTPLSITLPSHTIILLVIWCTVMVNTLTGSVSLNLSVVVMIVTSWVQIEYKDLTIKKYLLI